MKAVKEVLDTSSRVLYSSKANIEIYDVDFADVTVKKEILSSISNHTSSGYRIRDIETPSAVLTFVDELEELDNLDPEKAFKGRCRRFLTLFNVTELSDALKLRLRCIGRRPQLL